MANRPKSNVLEPSTDEDLATQLETFEDMYASPTRLAYPGSLTDVTPSETLDDHMYST
jgi:hypothetical protein